MTADYKQLAEELYKTLKDVYMYLPVDRRFPDIDIYISNVDEVLKKYEETTTRGTGRTTALYHKAITEALENPGKSVEFIDHYPHNWMIAKSHAEKLEKIINKLGYDIVVSAKGQAQVFLYNRFGQ
jgi:hypothetical protein